MAAPSIRNVGTALFGTASTLAPVPPGHSANDILLCCIGSSANASVTPTHSMPGDWTLVGSNANTTGTIRARCSVYYKRTAGSEATPTVTFTPTGSTACHHSAVIISVQLAITSGDPTEGTNTNQAAGASALALTLTTSTTDVLAILSAHHADNVATGVTDDGSFGSRIATDNGTGIDGFLAVRDKTVGAPGSGKGATVTFTSGGTGVGIAGVVFALKPVAETEATAREAQLASLEKTGTAREAQLASLDAPATAREAQTSLLEQTSTARQAQLSTLDALVLAREAQNSTLDAPASAREAQLASLDATGASRKAQLATLDAIGTARVAQHSTLEAAFTARVAQLAEMLATVGARQAQHAALTAENTSRTAQLSSLTYYATPRVAQLTQLTSARVNLVAQVATLYSPASRAGATANNLVYRGCYQLFPVGETTIVHGCKLDGFPASPYRTTISPRMALPAGSSIYMKDYDNVKVIIVVEGSVAIRADIFIEIPHSMTEERWLDH